MNKGFELPPSRKHKYVKVFPGSVVGRLTVQRKSEQRSPNGSVIWECSCSCGEIVHVQSSSLNSGLKRSCGCYAEQTKRIRKSTHSLSGTREYRSWQGMKQRCYYEKSEEYPRYGGRGIKVCERWKDNFSNFLEDMGCCPKGMSLDRIDVNGDYSPCNCRWATSSVQGFNTRKHSNNTSGNSGVSYHRNTNKWQASIGYQGKSIYLGCFDNKQDAILERKKAEILYFGEEKND